MHEVSSFLELISFKFDQIYIKYINIHGTKLFI
jgi:hypothetical protein